MQQNLLLEIAEVAKLLVLWLAQHTLREVPQRAEQLFRGLSCCMAFSQLAQQDLI